MIACVSVYTESWKELADITLFKNRSAYAMRHGYLEFFKRSDAKLFTMFEKTRTILECLETYPFADWIWWGDCDLMVTNMDSRLEPLIDDDFKIIGTDDCHGFNAGSMLIKNDPETVNFLRLILSREKEKKAYHFGDQAAIRETLNDPKWGYKWRKIFKFVPQRWMNSYDYGLYENKCDAGQWEKGDFVIHWPGHDLKLKIEQAKKYEGEVI